MHNAGVPPQQWRNTSLTTHRDPQELSVESLPQLILLLDEEGRLIRANRSRAGSRLSLILNTKGQEVHKLVHEMCSGDCAFNISWGKSWHELQHQDLLEWEVADTLLDKVFRLSLRRLLHGDAPPVEAETGHAVLMITDITQPRQAHLSLRDRNKEMGDLIGEFRRRLRALSSKLILAQENERRRIASELHDGIAQSLSVIKYGIEHNIELLKAEGKSTDVRPLSGIVDQIKSVSEEVRRIARNLAPSMLDDFGILATLGWLCSEFQSMHPSVSVERYNQVTENDVPVLLKVAIYRLLQEAFNNIAKHAEASVVRVRLEMPGDHLILTVQDNGKGFELLPLDSGAAHEHVSLGLRNMRERVEATGGNFELESKSGVGTTIRAAWSAAELRLLGDEAVGDGVGSDR